MSAKTTSTVFSRTASAAEAQDAVDLDALYLDAGYPVRAAPVDAQKLGKLVAITAVVFAAMFTAALLFINSAPHVGDPAAVFTAFYRDGNTALVTTGLYLVPFAGIAFMWNMTVLRQLIRGRSPSAATSIPYALQLLGGIVFTVLVFAGMATAGGVALLTELGVSQLPPVEVTRTLLAVGYGMVFIYAVRGAGMFVITTTTLLLRAGLLPRWVALLGYLGATVMLISTTLNPAVLLLFPAWSVLIALTIVVRTRRSGRAAPVDTTDHDTR